MSLRNAANPAGPMTSTSPWADPDVRVVSYTRHADRRGSFAVGFRQADLRELGLPHDFVQDCWSTSAAGVLRGLHFQPHPPMGKLIRVARGEAFLAAANVWPGSPFYRLSCTVRLTGDDDCWVWAPAHYARGYLALTDDVEVHYKCSAAYDARYDRAVRWDDPDLDIEWPHREPILSDRDSVAPFLAEAATMGHLDFASAAP